MKKIEKGNNEQDLPFLDGRVNEEIRRKALLDRCQQYRENLETSDPHEIARRAAMRIEKDDRNNLVLCGEYYDDTCRISFPNLTIFDTSGSSVSLQVELLWLHYLDRADGSPLVGRWVNLSEIGGLFYQQAFQGYCGDELAESWGSDIEGLKQACIAKGGWPISGLGDLAFEWRILPRLPICLCYRRPAGEDNAWATMLFDAAAAHYIAADVAAIVGKNLADSLKKR